MSYLDRLKDQNSEKQATKALSKLPKAPYDSFGSSQIAHFSENTMSSSTDTVPAIDDRQHCRECMNLRNSCCIRQRFRPVDDIPRRCEDFMGYPAPTEPPKLPKGRMVSEAAHNATGHYFKWLITRQDGTQFYSCQIPRMTLHEIRIQYYDAAAIEPVENEGYSNDE
ncbi:hypothetical protein [Candidatus Methylomicrobium oryzae]|uniref:hypothetical protein n=1 Tax=Candidatus Methylomicrobium oryzae TaxID=2802053 RepID=UPI0019240EC7|nr:hypothetical protein [Methylomicrobium sp. RS1]MBL1264523.1 hypothetical protein [Methylomicrobium sp. RS1]